MTLFPNSGGKIRAFNEMPKLVGKLKEAGLTVILAQGVFDIPHMGHFAYLEACNEIDLRNGIVIVGVDNDETVRRNKGDSRPINSLEERLQLIARLRQVDFVFGYTDIPDYNKMEDYVKRYRTLSPTILAVSSHDSYRDMKEQQAIEAGIDLRLVQHPYDNSTTRMLQRLGYS